ncbi:MAG: hypothetical protein H0X34_02595 [Chthoniobacterales bacterium]|nr:hypothetical protein [Chthoniobacterales bacterium]
MKIKIALCLLAAALLPACTTTRTASNSVNDKSTSYANNAVGEEPAPPAEGPAEADIPSEGPADVAANPAYVPTPLLRRSAATGP